jgi:hypothetical protein
MAQNELRLFVAFALRYLDFRLAPGTPAAVPPMDGTRIGLGSAAPLRDMDVQVRARRL